MRLHSLLILSVLLMMVTVLSGPPPPPPPAPSAGFNFEEDQNVLILRHSNIEKALRTFSHLLVLFHTPWCLPCKTLMPEYTKAASHLRMQGSKVTLAKVDCVLERELVTRYEIKSYPTIKLFLNGNITNYTGGRTEQEMVNWLAKTTKIPCKPVESLFHLGKFTYVNDVVVIFWGDTNTPEYQIYEAVSREVPELPFVFTTSAEVQAKYRDPAVLVTILKAFEEPVVHFTEDFEQSKLKAFLKEHRYPLIMNFQDKYAKRIFGDKNPLLILTYDKDQPETKDAITEFTAAAQKLKGKILIGMAAKDSEWGPRLVEFLGGTYMKLPIVAILKPLEGQTDKYIHKGNITVNNIVDFFHNFAHKRLFPALKTAPVPKVQDGPVTVLVGKTYREFVNNPQKDVFVLLFAPWCKHSQATSQVWEDLAKYTASIENLSLAKMDTTTNEIDGLNVINVPHILLYPSNNKTSPTLFRGHRTLNGFWNWLREHLTVEYDQKLLPEMPQDQKLNQQQQSAWNTSHNQPDMTILPGPPGMPMQGTPMMPMMPPKGLEGSIGVQLNPQAAPIQEMPSLSLPSTMQNQGSLQIETSDMPMGRDEL